MKHWIAWHPHEAFAYRADTEAEARAMVTGLSRYGGHGDWIRCRADGWRLLSIDDPNADSVGAARRPSGKTR